MNTYKMSCASCGASLNIPEGVNRLTCAFCGSELVIEMGEGYATLKLAEQVSQTIQQTGLTTQVELRRLQVGQELTAAQLQLSNLQSEIRVLRRQKQDRETRDDLMDLLEQEKALRKTISTIYDTLGISRPEPSAPRKAQYRMSTRTKIILAIFLFAASLVLCPLLFSFLG